MIGTLGFRIERPRQGLGRELSRGVAGILVGFAPVLLVAGCAREETPAPIPVLFPAAYTDTTLEFPQVRYANGSVCLNDRCPVRKVKLNVRLEPLFVNGRPIGFC